MTAGDDDRPATFASPPCFMHELDPAWRDPLEESDPRAVADVKRWRKAERERLVGARLAVPAERRRAWTSCLASRLESAVGGVDGRTVAVYWPFRGEPDLRGVMARVVSQGGRCALPVVVARGRPLVFRRWSPGDALDRGVWNIPIPKPDAPEVVPDVVVAPVVGFDRAGDRLGHGGGFYDRTLAAMTERPRVLGVGYALAALATIHPQWHDIPMDAVITEEGRLDPEAAPEAAG